MSADIPQISNLAVKLAEQHNYYDAIRFDLVQFEPLQQVHVEYLTEQFHREDTSFLVAVVEDKVVGYAFLGTEPQSLLSLLEKSVWLHDLYFEESIRGKGFSDHFFDAIISEAKKLGSSFLMLGVSPKNTRAQKFFAKMGFRPTMQEMRLDF